MELETTKKANEFDKVKANEIVNMVLDFVQSLKPTPTRPGQEDVVSQFDTIVNYKREQAKRIIQDVDTFTWQDVMMYLSCPLHVESKDEIGGIHGLRSKTFPYNGILSESLAKNILKYSIMYQNIHLAMSLPDDGRLTLISTQEVIDHYSPSMLPNLSKLVYLFMTGRGEEFNRVFTRFNYQLGNTNTNGHIEDVRRVNEDFLGRIDRYDVKEDEFLHVVRPPRNSVFDIRIRENDDLDEGYLKYLKEDLEYIKSRQKRDVAGIKANKTLKGA